MKTMYFKEDRYLEDIADVHLVNEDVEKAKYAIQFNDVEYQLIKKLPEGGTVIGYCEVSKRQNKRMTIKKEKVRAIIEDRVPVKKKQALLEDIVGYIKIDDVATLDNLYVACVKKNYTIIIVLLFILCMLCGFPLGFRYMGNEIEEQIEEQVVPGTDDKGNGELGKDTPVFEQGPTFRMRLNCTPAIEDGKINIRIESPAEDNEGFSFITEVYVLGEMNADGEVTETYTEPMLIYTSPIVYANENVEYGTLTEEVSKGRYLGRALYQIYDEEGNFLTQTACKLSIVSK